MDRILEIVKVLSSRYKRSGDWYNFSCPFAKWRHDGGTDNHPSFGISTGGYYHCFACGARGSITELGAKLFRYGHPKADMITKLSFGIEVKHNPEVEILEPCIIPESILRRFKRVGGYGAINEQSAELFELRFDPATRAVLFPVRDLYGRLVGIRARIGSAKLELRQFTPVPLKKCGIWYGMHLINIDQPIYLVEGERDAILMFQAGKQAMASLGNPSRQQIEMLNRLGGKYYVLFDSDKAGQTHAVSVLNRVPNAIRLLLPIGAKDPAEAVEMGLNL